MSRREGSNKGCLAALFGVFGGGSRTTITETKTYPYRVRDAFLTPAETSFYHVLHQVVDGRVTIFTKVNLWDIFYVAQPHKHPGARPHIAQKHVDFLLCRPDNLQPIIGIELDDSSHEKEDRRQRDAAVDAVFNAAELPLLHIPAKHGYAVQELQAQLKPHVSGLDSPTPHQPPPASISLDADGRPLCPKCGAPMTVRVARQGQHTGQKFYACSNYPNCKNIIPLKA